MKVSCFPYQFNEDLTRQHEFQLKYYKTNKVEQNF